MNTKRVALGLLIVLVLCAIAPVPALASGSDVWQLVDEQGKYITSIGADVDVGDEYISKENKYYRVLRVDGAAKQATMELVGEEPMFSVAMMPVAKSNVSSKKIGMYCTHSDESYENVDGTSSTETGWAGIHDVATQLQQQLEALGVEVNFDLTGHLPHDAGAYRRSRATAVELAKTGVAALFDIHRDGIPDPAEYETTVGGEDVTMVRLLVGRSNPNSAANKEFAKKIKSAGDAMYPGLMKDIFIGKGNYNQEIMPQSVLIEFGTHTSDKEQVIKSTRYMADVLNTVLFGGGASAGAKSTDEQNASEHPSATKGAAGGVASPAPSLDAQGQNPNVQPQAQKNDASSGSGAWKGIAWIVGIAIVFVVGFALVSAGTFSGLGGRLKGFASELTGGAVGRRNDEDHERDE